jgi:hypothetical protein
VTKEPHRWKPGVSGNPGGKPRIATEIRKLAQEKAPAAFQKLIKLLDSPKEQIQLQAAKEILKLAGVSFGDVTVNNVGTVNALIPQISTQDLLAALRARPAVPAEPAIIVEAKEIK